MRKSVASLLCAVSVFFVVLQTGCLNEPRLTLEEYEAWCSKLDDTDPPETWGEAVDIIETFHGEGVGLNPPEVLQEYAHTHLELLELLIALYSRFPEDDPLDIELLNILMESQDEFRAIAASIEALDDELDAIKGDLPSEVRSHLFGCA